MIEQTSREISVFSGCDCLSFLGEGGVRGGKEREKEKGRRKKLSNLSSVILRGRGTTKEEERKRGLALPVELDNLIGLICVCEGEG